MIFQYKFEHDIKKINSLIKFKKLDILDFGCGIGNWPQDIFKYKSIKKITLYDSNKKLKKVLQKKYMSKKINIDFEYRNIIKINSFNLIIFSSVIQYISKNKLKKIIKDLTKNKKQLVILITDIPYIPRILEFLFLPMFNLKRFFYILKLCFSKKYIKLNYFLYKLDDFEELQNIFDIKRILNLHDLKILRYSVILSLKNN